MTRNFDSIALEAAGRLRPLLAEAFEAGRAEGRREAQAEFRDRLSDIFGESPKQSLTETPAVMPTTTREPPDGRAAPGTVKPVIRDLLRESPEGLTTEEIIRRTGIKRNSVRGTVFTLKQEGEIERRGDRWVPAPFKKFDGEGGKASGQVVEPRPRGSSPSTPILESPPEEPATPAEELFE